MNQYQLPPSSIPSQKGAVLLEALIAVVIFSFGVLALAGLQSAMVKNTSNAKYRADATFLAQQKLGEIWANAKNLTGIADYVVTDEYVSLLPEGKRTVTVSPERVVTVSITWTVPGEATHTYSTNARIEGVYDAP